MKIIQFKDTLTNTKISFMVSDVDFKTIKDCYFTLVKGMVHVRIIIGKKRYSSTPASHIIKNAKHRERINYIDGNKFNLQRSNLIKGGGVLLDVRKGRKSTSNFYGVYLSKINDRLIPKKIKVGKNKAFGYWRSKIRLGKKIIHIGHFNTELKAARAYDVIAKKNGKKRINFPD